MPRNLALITALGAALAAPLPAQVPSTEGLVSVIAKSDALKTATGAAQIEAAMAVCLALGDNPEIVEMVFAEHGWARTADSHDVFVVLGPAGAAGSPEVYLDLQDGPRTCAVRSATLGGEAAHGLVKGLLGAVDPAFNTVNEGDATVSCIKHNFALPTFPAGRVYVTVLDDSGDEPSCQTSDSHSLTTFAFVEH